MHDKQDTTKKHSTDMWINWMCIYVKQKYSSTLYASLLIVLK